ncbi:MAG: VOC family protein [Rhodothermales bacterium]
MGRPIHFEILTEHPEQSAAFYKAVFGWDVATWDGPQNYWLMTTGPEGTPGINGAVMHNHMPQAVINTVEVVSVDEALKRVEAAGGKLVMGPNDIPGVGRHLYCADPNGVILGLLQPAR